jgi:hypothetical protein
MMLQFLVYLQWQKHVVFHIRNKQKSLGARSDKLKGRYYTISDEVPLGNQNFVPTQHTTIAFFS